MYSSGISHDYTGLGTRQTWYGSPDCYTRGCGSTPSRLPMIYPRSYKEQESSDTDGDTMQHDAKLRIKRKHLPQLVSMNVVDSFTAANRHSNLSRAVPSIIISPEEIVISLYNTRSDELFLSENVVIATYNNVTRNHELMKSGVLLLWLLINHR